MAINYVVVNYKIKGKHISWQHLRDLYKKCQNSTGLTLLKKIKWEHLFLTSYSRMRVDLAVQVIIIIAIANYTITP